MDRFTAWLLRFAHDEERHVLYPTSDGSRSRSRFIATR
jgi:hypothetical protein